MKSLNSKLFKNTIFLYIFSFVKLVFPLLTLPYLTRVLSTDTYGVVAYVKALNSYVILILDFGFLLSATKEIAKNKENLNIVGRITGNVLIEKIILAIFSICFLVVMTNSNSLLKGNILFVWLYFSSTFISIFIPDFLFRGIEKMEYVVLPFTISKSIVTFATFIVIQGDGDFMNIAYLEIIGNSISAFIAMFIVAKMKIKISFDNFKIWMKDLKESSIYFFSNCATTVFSLLTTVIIGTFMDPTDVAYWSLCMQFVSAAKAMYNPISNSLYPHMIVHKDIHIVNKIAKIFSIPMILGTIIVLFFGEDIMAFVGGEKYRLAGSILKYLLPVFIVSFYSMIYGWPVLGAINKIKETTFSTILSAILQLIVMVLLALTNNLSLYSMAFSCCIGEVSLLIIRLLILKDNYSLLLNKKG